MQKCDSTVALKGNLFRETSFERFSNLCIPIMVFKIFSP